MSGDVSEKKEIVKGKFYEITEDMTVGAKEVRPGGGHFSGGVVARKGLVFEGTDKYYSTTVYDGMPVKEQQHAVFFDSIKNADLGMFKSNSLSVSVSSLNMDFVEEVSKEMYNAKKDAMTANIYSPEHAEYWVWGCIDGVPIETLGSSFEKVEWANEFRELLRKEPKRLLEYTERDITAFTSIETI